MGRELRRIENVGELFRCQTQSYDLRGRLISSTDPLGRTSTTEYHDADSTSSDNSYYAGTTVYADANSTQTQYSYTTSIATTASGATIITSYHLDGSIAKVSGSAQVESYTKLELTDEGILSRQFITLDEQAVEVARSLSNGYGETICQYEPDTLGKTGLKPTAPTTHWGNKSTNNAGAWHQA
ncbi:MAG: hypothetical protein SNG49_09205 [Rikenellaceae bacterium]